MTRAKIKIQHSTAVSPPPPVPPRALFVLRASFCPPLTPLTPLSPFRPSAPAPISCAHHVIIALDTPRESTHVTPCPVMDRMVAFFALDCRSAGSSSSPTMNKNLQKRTTDRHTVRHAQHRWLSSLSLEIAGSLQGGDDSLLLARRGGPGNGATL